MQPKYLLCGIKRLVTNAGNLLATPEALGSLCVCFMCSMRASPPRNSLWQIGQDVALGPPIRAACCCNTGTRSCSSCERTHEDGRTLMGRLDTHKHRQHETRGSARVKYESETRNTNIKLLYTLTWIRLCLNKQVEQ